MLPPLRGSELFSPRNLDFSQSHQYDDQERGFPVVTHNQMLTLVEEQMRHIRHEGRRQELQRLLVTPRPEKREWDYGAIEEEYEYWVVAESDVLGVMLVYCDQGFGPDMPWGFLYTHDPECATLGMDSQWNWYLEEAFARSGLWPGGIADDDPIHLSPYGDRLIPEG